MEQPTNELSYPLSGGFSDPPDLPPRPKPFNTYTHLPQRKPCPKTFNAYSRLSGRKHFFTPPYSANAEYFIVNPTPNQGSIKWNPVVYRGDNPKYTSSKAISRAWRGTMWNWFRTELGDGVEGALASEERCRRQRKYERDQWLRRISHLKEMPPAEELEGEMEVKGFVLKMEMRKPCVVGRKLEWRLGGHEYRWSGTRMFLPRWARKMKGVSQDMKVRQAPSLSFIALIPFAPIYPPPNSLARFPFT